MMQILRAQTQRVTAAAARVVDAVVASLGSAFTGGNPTFGGAMTMDTTCAWNVLPSVNTIAIPTHGNKRYEWRLQEMLT